MYILHHRCSWHCSTLSIPEPQPSPLLGPPLGLTHTSTHPRCLTLLAPQCARHPRTPGLPSPCGLILLGSGTYPSPLTSQGVHRPPPRQALLPALRRRLRRPGQRRRRHTRRRARRHRRQQLVPHARQQPAAPRQHRTAVLHGSRQRPGACSCSCRCSCSCSSSGGGSGNGGSSWGGCSRCRRRLCQGLRRRRQQVQQLTEVVLGRGRGWSRGRGAGVRQGQGQGWSRVEQGQGWGRGRGRGAGVEQGQRWSRGGAGARERVLGQSVPGVG